MPLDKERYDILQTAWFKSFENNHQHLREIFRYYIS